MKKLTKAVSFAMFIMGCSTYADEVRIPIGSQSSDVEKPQRAMSKTSVEEKFGSPESRHGPSGQPAIYYWEYPDFTVYFEGDYVIHTVSKFKSNTAVKK